VGTGQHTHTRTRTSWIILDCRQFGTRPNALRGVEEAGLRGRDEADDERAVFIFLYFNFVVPIQQSGE
jgi:hypothetical protein